MKLLVLLLINSVTLAAAGGGADGHLSDLIVPAINFTIVFGFMGWKLIPMLRNSFNEKSESIKDLVEYAAKKDAKAQSVLDASKAKLDNIDSEKERIISNATNDANKFESDYVEEIAQNMKKMESDSANKLASEKKQMLRDLNESLLDEVIAKTKIKLESDKSLSDKATNNLISRL